MLDRRHFIQAITSIAAGSALAPLAYAKSPNPLSILFMGGTGFLGPHAVRVAMARGHKVTLFNRGKTNPTLFKSLPTIRGDRNTDAINQLKGKKFDVVIDTSAYFPRSVRSLLEVTDGNIGHYQLISTISVYQAFNKVGMDESDAVATIDDPTVEKVTGLTYGPLKALCEKVAREKMEKSATIIRPGLIVGPGDKTDRFTYWPVRIQRGGDILAPGTGNDFVQYIDVRDLADWMIHTVEQKVTGTFNAQTQGSELTMKTLLDTGTATLNPKANLQWVSADFLEKQEVAPWSDMPVWMPPTGDYSGMGTMRSDKAHAQGLQHRPLADSFKATAEWFNTLPDERKAKLRAGISADREKEVLKRWQSIKAKS